MHRIDLEGELTNLGNQLRSFTRNNPKWAELLYIDSVLGEVTNEHPVMNIVYENYLGKKSAPPDAALLSALKKFSGYYESLFDGAPYPVIVKNARLAKACIGDVLRKINANPDGDYAPMLVGLGKALARLPADEPRQWKSMTEIALEELVPEYPILLHTFNAWKQEKNKLGNTRGCNPISWVAGLLPRGDRTRN